MFDKMTRPRLNPQHTKSAALSERRPLSATERQLNVDFFLRPVL